MSNPTTPFSWQMPTATDLVTDLPADFEVFGQAVATSMADLLGGTSGQILAKNSNTDMDFVWIANDQGDITGITAGTGITVTSPTGPVPTVAIDTAVTVDKTTAQTLTNKTLTSPALTTPTISTATTNGDILYGTGSGALARLGIGSTSQVLTVAGGVPSWATPASGGGMTLINSGGTALSGTSVTISSIPGTYNELVIYIDNPSGSTDYSILLRVNNNSTASDYQQFVNRGSGSTDNSYVDNATAGIDLTGYVIDSPANGNMMYAQIPNYTSTTADKVINVSSGLINSSGNKAVCNVTCYFAQSAAVTSLVFHNAAATNYAGGTIYVYGVK